MKAFHLLKLAEWERIACIGHILNLCVKNGLELKQISNLVGKGRTLVSYFHHSPLAMDYLTKKQTHLKAGSIDLSAVNSQNHKLITDVKTRWNSTLHMTERLDQLCELLQTLGNNSSAKIKDIRPYLYSSDEAQLVEDMAEVLSPFHVATERLPAEKVSTLSLVYPTLKKLKKLLGSDDMELAPAITTLRPFLETL